VGTAASTFGPATLGPFPFSAVSAVPPTGGRPTGEGAAGLTASDRFFAALEAVTGQGAGGASGLALTGRPVVAWGRRDATGVAG
jgi:hypothetical protein